MFFPDLGLNLICKTPNDNHQMNELSLKERECKNMLASVLDMEDDHRYVQHQCDDHNKEDKDNEDADEDDNERDELSHKGGESHVAVAPTD